MKNFLRRLRHRYLSFRERRRLRRDNSIIVRQQEQIRDLRRQIEELLARHARDLEQKDSQITLIIRERDHYIAIYEREQERVTFETQNFIFRGEAGKK